MASMHYIFDGTLGMWHAPGTAGITWVLNRLNGNGPAHPVLGHRLLLREGDLLTIWDEGGREIFNRTIRPDFGRDWTPFPEQGSRVAQWLADRWESYSLSQREIFRFFLNGMPCVNGMWVTWLQRGVESGHWLCYFMLRADQPVLRARIMRPENPQRMTIHSRQRNLAGGNIDRP